MAESLEDTEEMLDFDSAMLDFRAMFPRVSAAQIELVLRKHDGDVSATINELLFDNTQPVASNSNAEELRTTEDALTGLRRRRHEINARLRENQRLLDTVTDVELARTYEDQQLAYLLEHREVSDLIREEKTKRSHGCSPPNRADEKREERNTKTSRSEHTEHRIPDGPLVGSSATDLAARIRQTFKKGSGLRISRMFQ